MEWRWSLKILTITIDGSWQDQPLATMVFQWFFQFWGPMVHDGYWKGAVNTAFFLTKNEICDKMRVNKKCQKQKRIASKTYRDFRAYKYTGGHKSRHILLMTLERSF